VTKHTSEKAAKSAQKLGQLQPSIAVFHNENSDDNKDSDDDEDSDDDASGQDEENDDAGDESGEDIGPAANKRPRP
jgi:hypothetical protein